MPFPESQYFGGLDLGQAQDYSAFVLIEKISQRYSPRDIETYGEMLPPLPLPVYHIKHLERLPLQMPYPQQVVTVKALLERPPLTGAVTLAVDYTGVGRPVVDMFRAAHMKCFLIPIQIHGGNTVTHEAGRWNVPKRDLISVVNLLLQNQTLKIASALPHAATLKRELEQFRMKIDIRTGHDSYEAWREGVHDDLVLSVALACWTAEKGPSPVVIRKYIV